MQTSPCRFCPLIDEDKNNHTCLNCKKRIRYVAELGRSLQYPATARGEDCNMPLYGDARGAAY